MAAENDTDLQLSEGDLEAVIRPGFGGLVSSLRWRGRELLDRGSRRGAAAIDPTDYVSGGLGGIDDCLPAIAPGTHPTHETTIPDHGELWYRPAEILGFDSRCVVLQISGEQLPFILTREFVLRNEELRVGYVLENMSDGVLPLVWAAHPLFATSPGMRIELPAALAHLHSGSPGVELAPDGSLRTLAGDCDPGDWEAIPDGTYAKLFGSWAGQASIVHPAWSMSCTVVLETDRPAHLGLWLNRNAIPAGSPSRHVAIEPTFGDSDALGAAIARQSCLFLEPRERAEWAVVYATASIEDA